MPLPEVKGEASLSEIFDTRKLRQIDNIKPHPMTGRRIDSYPMARTKPMRVLCLGQSRTGTMTLLTALKRLGYTPYHLSTAQGSPKTNLSLWREALDAKFHGKGKPWGRNEFDKMLGPYDAVLDIPAICFVQELVAAYPEAEVIVTQQDVDSWLRNMNSADARVLRWPLWNTLASFDSKQAGPFWEYSKKVMPASFHTMTDFSTNSPARIVYYDHYELVRRIVPANKMLEFRIEEGWAPLCKFLEKDIPNEKFPRVDESKDFVLRHKMMWWIAFAKMVGKGSLTSAVAGIFASMVAMLKLKYALNVVAMLRPVAGLA
ncbi:uncharacterized protein FIESC28_01692 [Fusarium coffeatum]|uniref:P-loop containing nucleoside triphosphate hydrolase protein n=1 Tax=Fusarium coffeatum TaxID=231269 RepID=A0A366S819_9HYPO|nr:uncharacterized protein FIESC28_01692 [Fusarium coffeatum]RBR25454.1 hypothetical protein FIESC28_01692 [Fusarium coffeatum]